MHLLPEFAWIPACAGMTIDMLSGYHFFYIIHRLVRTQANSPSHDLAAFCALFQIPVAAIAR